MKKNRMIALLLAVLTVLPLISAVKAADVSAYSAVLIEAESGDVIYEKNADVRLPMASTTKIMTAVVALEHCDCEKTVTVPAEACGVEGSSVYLTAGERLTVGELLYAMLLESANDAATAIAIETAGSVEAFADMMNEKAASLGLTNTHFTNPHGLYDEAHYTTAKELAKIAAYALRNPKFSEIVSTYKYKIPLKNGEGTRVLVNHNRLLRMSDEVIGVKTGFTKKSGRCLVSAAERDGVRVVAVTLNAPDDWNDHLVLLSEGLSAYESFTLAEDGQYSLELPAVYSDDGFLTVKNAAPLTKTMKTGTKVEATVEAPHIILTEVCAGDEVGRVVFSANGKEIASVPLVSCETTERPRKKNLFEKIAGLFRQEHDGKD